MSIFKTREKIISIKERTILEPVSLLLTKIVEFPLWTWKRGTLIWNLLVEFSVVLLPSLVVVVHRYADSSSNHRGHNQIPLNRIRMQIPHFWFWKLILWCARHLQIFLMKKLLTFNEFSNETMNIQRKFTFKICW